ncbi:MAG: DUF2156 domain-containing protein [Lachnospiraceae bacterium]|nr:DUF2156 domain-containing protein [Lachnospiraceae bacterium]
MKFEAGEEVSVDGIKYELKSPSVNDYEELRHYFMLRRPETSDSNIFSLFLWNRCYPSLYIRTEKGILFVTKDGSGGYYSVTPFCKDEDMKDCFVLLKKLYNNSFGKKLVVDLCDSKALKLLNLSEDEYIIERQRDFDDYIYDAEKLRTLSGKKYHKKKNHLNAFLRDYAGRYEFRTLTCSNRQEILDFLERWIEQKDNAEGREFIYYEAAGIGEVLDCCDVLEFNVGGVYIDDKLEAFSIGCYIKEDDMVYVPVEKANPQIRGLYNYISSEFLKRVFPHAGKVNREDDMGHEGLRKSKMSYHPIYMVEKSRIIQR